MAALRFDGLGVEQRIEIARLVFREARERNQGRRSVVPGEVLWWHTAQRAERAGALVRRAGRAARAPGRRRTAG